jgi:hypothetical protein
MRTNDATELGCQPLVNPLQKHAPTQKQFKRKECTYLAVILAQQTFEPQVHKRNSDFGTQNLGNGSLSTARRPCEKYCARKKTLVSLTSSSGDFLINFGVLNREHDGLFDHGLHMIVSSYNVRKIEQEGTTLQRYSRFDRFNCKRVPER